LIGHGEFDQRRDEGRLFLADEQGKAQAISATQLNRLLAFQRGTLRLALLNACEGARGGKFDVLSSTAATLVLGGLPAVLAMQYAITDTAALEFARTFYGALADNLPVDAAVADARNAINLQDEYSLEWGTPVLFMRTADGSISVWGQDFPGRKKWRILGGRWKSKRKNKEQKDAKPSRTQDKIDANCGSGD
jgi:hypothetical protein